MYLNLCIFSGIGRSKKSYSNFPWRRELCWIQKRCLNSNCKVRFSSLLLSNFKSPCRSFLLFILLSAGSMSLEISYTVTQTHTSFGCLHLHSSIYFWFRGLSHTWLWSTALMVLSVFYQLIDYLEYVLMFAFLVRCNLMSFTEEEEYMFFP